MNTTDMTPFWANVMAREYPTLAWGPLEFKELSGRDDALGQSAYRLYRVTGKQGSWLLHAYHDTFEGDKIFAWVSRERPFQRWLQSRLRLLNHLAQCHYPAPRVLPASKGLLCQQQSWTIFVTDFLEGSVNLQDLIAIEGMGSALGRLHQLPVSMQVAPSAIQYGIVNRALQCIRDMLQDERMPQEYRDLASHFCHTFEQVLQAWSSLPESLVHGDVWSPNAVVNGTNVTLIDWELAGRGPAVLDLGIFLLYGQCDQHGDFPEHADKERILASVKGYQEWRLPTNEELACLLHAVRFARAWRAMLLFQRAQEQRWPATLNEALARTQRGYRLAEEVALHAVSTFATKC